MEAMIQELRFALRHLRSTPGLTLLMVLTLALGIGAATAIYSFADVVLFRSLPYDEPDRLVRIFNVVHSAGTDRGATSFPDYFDWVDRSETLQEIAGFVRWNYNVNAADSPQRVWGSMVTENLFRTLGAETVVGRGFLPEEDRPGGEKVVLLGHGYWQRAFGGDPGVVGTTLRLDDVDHRIVGVLEPGFEYPSDAQLWTPLGYDRNSFPRAVRALRVVARLAPGHSIQSAQNEMAAIMDRLAAEYPQSNAGRTVLLIPMHEFWIGDLRTPLMVLMGAALLVLLLAAANVSHLLLTQALDRQGEIHLQRALGASRKRLVLRLFSQGTLLAVFGGLAGLAFGALAVRVLVAVARAQQEVSFLAERLYSIPRLTEVSLDARAALFALVLVIVVSVVVSLVPLLLLSDRHLARGLHGTGRSALGGRGVVRLREALVVAEIGLALMLLLDAGLLIRSYRALQDIDLGFRTEGVTTFQVALPPSSYPGPQQTQAFFRDLLERVESTPGVRSAGLTWGLPLSDLQATVAFQVEGRPPTEPGQENRSRVQPVSEGYLPTLGTPLVAGRHLERTDYAESLPVALVNEALVRRFFPDENPLGKRIVFGANFGPLGMLGGAPREIVGVVGNQRNLELAKEPEPEIYVSFRQNTWRMMTVVVRTERDPLELMPLLREEVWELNPNLAVSQQETLEQIVGRARSHAKLYTLILSAFATIALILACVGVFGAVAYSVQRRTREFGLRMAVGADRRDLVREAWTRGAWMTCAGLALGLLGGLLSARALTALLFETPPADPANLVLGLAAMLLLGLAAAWLPARRASRIDPMAALRVD